MSPELVAAFPILVLVGSIAFALYCLNDLAHAEAVLFLPREVGDHHLPLYASRRHRIPDARKTSLSDRPVPTPLRPVP
jgi:hypothetical protein